MGLVKNAKDLVRSWGLMKILLYLISRYLYIENCVVPWKGEVMQEWKNKFVLQAENAGFPIHRSYMELSHEERDILWQGNESIKGINAFFTFVESQSYKIQYRVMFSRYRGKTQCPDCKGTRLRRDANYVKVVNIAKQAKLKKSESRRSFINDR